MSLHRVSITHLTKNQSLLKMVLNSVMDPDPVGSASFCRIGIGIQRLSNPDPDLHYNGKSDPDTGRRSTTLVL